jgi:O-antigen ligase
MRNRLIINAGFLLLGVLFFIWPVPGTISVRDLSISLLFIIFLYSAFRTRPLHLKTKELATPFVILAVLTIWILFEAFFISTETAWSLREITGQWLISLLVFVTAALAAVSVEEGTFFKSGNIVRLLFFILLAHILYVDLYAIYVFATTSVLPTWVFGLTGGKDKSSYLSHFLLMILCVEIYFRTRQKKGSLPINNRMLYLALLLTLFSVYLEGVRNGTVAAVLLLFAFILLYFLKNDRSLRRLALISSFIALLLVFGYISSISSKSEQRHRWMTFLETVPLALDTRNNKAWLNPNKYPYPKLKSGETVHGSNYERIAWIKEGIVLIMENPLGVGFGRNAFGHAIKRKYPAEEVLAAHSHSGVVDLAVGTGVPGLLLWVLFIGCLMLRSIEKFRHQESYYGLLLFFIAADFTLRSLVDSVLRDHMLQMFMFFAGLLYVLMLSEKEEMVI